ncbi:sensor histidine kinase [Jannaschia pohangensis]|uniref:Signal transduction histidine-protein kinase/phosphatase MprB n=1 Tax=Jannaschia pohangensis TaxID=390807 RepID=A0A1I3USI5_9RHOB|nr:HAMP domain-containing sensor histidine kinase [Jannaschia pohangensis]SFJ85905.1 Signal transduction histidine kinase [Jannaschia pohangensis]
MSRRWRPPLALVLGGALLGTLVLSLLGLIALRYLGPVVGFRQAAISLALAIAALTLIPWWLMLRLLLRPVRDLSAYAAQVRVRPGTAPPAPGHYGTPELHEMGTNVMAMAQVLQARESSVRSFADHVTHEVKGPVAAIRAASELLSDSGLSPDDRTLLDQIGTATLRIEAQLAALARVTAAREADHRGETRLSDLALKGPPSLQIDGKDVQIPLARDGLQAVLDHLIDNAARHGASEVAIRATRRDGGVEITVQDDGSGISDGNRARIFNPFFTTRRESGGTGMGLAITSALLQANGGTITLAPSPTGTAFRIVFRQNSL